MADKKRMRFFHAGVRIFQEKTKHQNIKGSHGACSMGSFACKVTNDDNLLKTLCRKTGYQALRFFP